MEPKRPGVVHSDDLQGFGIPKDAPMCLKCGNPGSYHPPPYPRREDGFFIVNYQCVNGHDFLCRFAEKTKGG